MSKVFIQEDTLTNIANAIREKNGTTEPIAPQNMADAIGLIQTNQEIEPVVLSGDCSNACSGQLGNLFFNYYSDIISTDNISSAEKMFYYTDIKKVPFKINFTQYNNNPVVLNLMFSGSKIEGDGVPEFSAVNPRSTQYLFSGCPNLNYIPEDFASNWNTDFISKNQYNDLTTMIRNCYSLRVFPYNLYKWAVEGGQNTSTYHSYNQLVYGCYTMDEINNLPIRKSSSSPQTLFSNVFKDSFVEASRLKNVIFEMDNNTTPRVVKWKNQTLDFTKYLGYVQSNKEKYILDYNSGITADKKVIDDATYQTLKNNPDWYSLDINYSRYNHDSAVATINSLPDASAYLATETSGTNTIKFKWASGALTDGGAINTLTAEEIAVATVKGWTVSFV